ncbi:FkbM family methyltransferase [Anabaena sp. UHCC 0451]|uniref:FkbM family methyltransferase n=1 Tax=Anabaena sp. UHCC 0451 TaxID=2055235 RepID=UPI002B200033|nr:FkbM family methyltransferase [Anabaena sp. UHCC 0451]MEA5575965.1 FkbM family methyltransferase [Anabaena sp. UHCC 0451]
MPFPKHIIKAVFQSFGYQVRKCPKSLSSAASFLHLDPFYDQQFLLRNIAVDTIFDIGAHIGETAKQYHQLFPKAKIVSFEPFPDSYAQLSEFSATIEQIEAHNLAVDTATGEKTFYSTSFSPMNSLLPLAESSGKHYEQAVSTVVDSIHVKATSLDDFCKNRNIQKIQICKMDIQGAELLALQGAVELLTNKGVDLFYLEVSFNEIYQNQALFYQICDFLARYDYKLFGVYNLYHGKNNLSLVAGDALFLSPRIADSLE